MPLLIEGDAAARPQELGCFRRAPGARDGNRSVAEGRGPPNHPVGVHQARQEHVPDGGMIRPEEAQRPYTVTELANEIRRELRPLTALLVKGEVSGMKQGAGGHYNFTIRDGVSRLDAVLFADDARRLTTLPDDGQAFIFRGRVDFFGKTRRLSFLAA